MTLDAGALIAVDRYDRRVVALLARATERGLELAVPTGVIAQVWRDGRTQARLARFLGTQDVVIVPLDDHAARAAGQLCGVRRTRDIVDASVVICARARGHQVVTSDAHDLRALDPALGLIEV